MKQTLERENERMELYDVYGITEGEIKGKECVICMTDDKNTMMLPCRHLIVCSRCSGEVTARNKKCPICRLGMRNMAIILIGITSMLNIQTGELMYP